MKTIKLISERWLEQKKSQADFTKDAENKAAIIAEIVEAEKHVEARSEVEAAAAKLGYRRNGYAGTCKATGVEVKPGCGFAKKSVNGRWETFSFVHVQAEVNHPGVE